jgi:non-ribosomal peptide synthetase component F
MRNVPVRPTSTNGLEVERVLGEGETAAFDISLELGEEGNHFMGALRYNTSLFDQLTIMRMASHYQNILFGMLSKPEFPISKLEILPPSERQQLVVDWNSTWEEFPQECLHSLITMQAAKNPESIAVICNGRQLTYSALEHKANKLSSYILAKGIRSGELVGIFLPRSEELQVCQLAVLKSGAAYLPLDLTYPVERLTYMLEDANPAMVITQSDLVAQLPGKYQKVCLDTETSAIQFCPDQGFAVQSDGDTTIYVTYTSGSTGRPKGVLTLQRGVMNYLHFLIT